MQVTIDGVPYAPASVVSSRIGIAISTHQRADVLKRSLEQHLRHLPAGALVVVDTACDWVKPIYLTDHDIDVLDRQTKRDILAHNKAWQANCQKEKADLK